MPLADTAPGSLLWRVHTPNLLAEVFNNGNGVSALAVPFAILVQLLTELAETASELNDPRLNLIMARLTLYDAADPKSDIYDPELIKRLAQLAQLAYTDPTPTNNETDKMKSTLIVLQHQDSGDVATPSDWAADYAATDVESWHGKPADECNPIYDPADVLRQIEGKRETLAKISDLEAQVKALRESLS